MSKSLKDLFELYKETNPKKGENFLTKQHPVSKHDDRNGNGDDVFKASNIKTAKRNTGDENHGYDASQSDAVWKAHNKTKKVSLTPSYNQSNIMATEDVDQIDELSKKTLGSYINKANRSSYKAGMDAGEAIADGDLDKELKANDKMSARRKGVKLATDRLTKEEVELTEGVSVSKKAYHWGKMITVHDGAHQSFPLHPEHQAKIAGMTRGDIVTFKDETGKTIHAERTGNLVHLKQHGSNRTAAVAFSHFKEDVDQIDELSKNTMKSYMGNALNDLYSAGKTNDHNRGMKRYKGIQNAAGKLTKEETQIDELSKETLGRYVEKAAKSQYGNALDLAYHYNQGKGPNGHGVNWEKHGQIVKKVDNRDEGISKAVKKLTKESVINNAIDTYITDKLVPIEERFLDNISQLSENTQELIINLFDSLSDENKSILVDATSTLEGINEVIDFALGDIE